MKQPLSTGKMRAITFALAGILLLTQSLQANNKPTEDKPLKKNKTKNSKSKNISSLNNNSVKIYPDILKREMHVISKEDKEQLDFFVFDIQGTLVQHHKLNSKDHYKIAGLARGKYIYRAFSGDDETASGQFEIR
ncbi:MAG TPA: T9SS type A sorting domain-containing protein [Chitinophagaceae bacterium]|nr:T9SS type A sorting domain-containing protein [Chitinophagaceae bacterium]